MARWRQPAAAARCVPAGMAEAWLKGDPAAEAWMDGLEVTDPDWHEELFVAFLSTPVRTDG